MLPDGNIEMAKRSTPSTQSSRLIRAVQAARGPAFVVHNPPDNRAAAAMSPNKSVQKAIKYPNASTALRKHVVETRKSTKPITTVRLRLPLSGGSTGEVSDKVRPAKPAVALEALSPSPALRPDALVPRAHDLTIDTTADLGGVVRRARRRRELSQAGLAELAGTGRRFVSELEAGKPTIEFERLLAVCRVLGIHLSATLDSDGR